MEKFPVLQNELMRLEKLYSYNILNMEPEDGFDNLTKLAASILAVPVCQITLMDANWQTFISNVGTNMKGNYREIAFCKYCVVQENILEIEDATKDERFSQNPLVINKPNLRYYIGAPLMDKDGYIIGTVCGYDIKPRQMSDSQKIALKQITSTVMRLIHLRKVDLNQNKYKGIVNLSQDLLCTLSKDGFLTEFNPAICEILDATREELLSREFSQWVHPEDIDSYIKLFHNFDQVHTGLIFRLKKSDGEFITIEWSSYFSIELNIIVLSGHDISEVLSRQSELQESIMRANEAVQMKDQFLSDMSHEIRTPLASIVGFNELLTTSNLSTEQKSYADAVNIAAESLINIVNEVLDVYKFTNHEVTLDPSSEDLYSILNKVKKLYALKAASKNIALELDFDEQIPNSLNIDRTRLIQIISSLTSNAIKFTRKGSVTISAKLVSKLNNLAIVEFSVNDTGIGINQSHQDAIFECSKQSNEATWKQYGGTGLGLNIVKLLVELHNSNLVLKSIPNKGTTFSFEVTFSLSDLKTVIKASSKTALLNIPSLNGIQVLLAEDNKHLQILCKTFIERNEGVIHIVSNGQEAIKYLTQHTVDVVLLDMQMPLINGIQVAKYIRNELNLNCPVIVCSANLLDLNYTPEDLKYLDEFIPKPYTEFRLITEILQQFESKASNSIKDDFKTIMNELRKKEGDALVNEFEKIFRNRIPQDIDDLIRARENKNFDEIQNKAHYLLTTLLTLKFEQGFGLAGELEKAVDNNKNAYALMLTDRFIDYLNTALKEI